MRWLSSRKARLGLLVNGLYLVILLAPPLYWWRARVFPHTSERHRRALVYAPLPPAAGPSKAITYRGHGTNHVEVYLTQDLTLVEQPGHRLLLSPIYTADADAREPPDTILFRFVSCSRAQFYDDDSPLVILADGEQRWPVSSLLDSPTPSDPRARHSATDGGDGQIVETVGEAIPYELFAEMVGASRVSVWLGQDRVTLSGEQLEALRDLHRKLPRPKRRVASGGL